MKSPAKFAEATADWLDPHGLWSIAPDAPVGGELRHDGERLLAELQAPVGAGSCAVAPEVGGELVAWSEELRLHFMQGEQEGAEKGAGLHPLEAWKLSEM